MHTDFIYIHRSIANNLNRKLLNYDKIEQETEINSIFKKSEQTPSKFRTNSEKSNWKSFCPQNQLTEKSSLIILFESGRNEFIRGWEDFVAVESLSKDGILSFAAFAASG